MWDINDFIFFPNGIIEVGIDSSVVDNIYLDSTNTKITKDYIAASSPKKIIHYDQFYIQKKLLTVENFRMFVLDTSYVTESEKAGWGWVWNNKWIKKENVFWENPFLNEADLYYNNNADIFPVMQISWNDAVEYTKWMTVVTGENFRLPFEYEWEILGNHAGLNSITNTFINNKEHIESDNDFLIKLKENIKNSKFQLGLLWEWTLDWYDSYDGSVSNKDFGNIYKSLRGGSLLSDEIQKSKEFRFRRCPTARSPYYSFRVVLDKSKLM